MSSENNVENMDAQQAENPTINDKNESSLLKTGVSENRIQAAPRIPPKAEENTGVAIKQMENESLNSLLVYDSDSSSSSEMMKINPSWQARDDSEDSTSSSSSSSSEESESESEEEVPQNRGAIKKDNPPKTEMYDDGLPPVPDISKLSINVENESFEHMGDVLGIVDKLVTVAALPNTPAYDLDTLLFLDNGRRPLGFVFDVLGQVTSPIYAVRFNSAEDIKILQVEVGTKVYSAPTSKHTQYVFLQQLLKMKGSDASWVGDDEVPSEFADFSDDENECGRRFGSVKVAPHLKRTHSGDNYKKFETTMNKRNLLNTKFNKYMDSYKQARLNKTKNKRQINPSVPLFDPSIPPPTVRPVHCVPPQYFEMYHEVRGGGENNNTGGFTPGYFTNNFAANLSPSAGDFFMNRAGGNHPGPSHE